MIPRVPLEQEICTHFVLVSTDVIMPAGGIQNPGKFHYLL